jgi:23S rRNA pseudoU1915 N3-methylase RlmH
MRYLADLVAERLRSDLTARVNDLDALVQSAAQETVRALPPYPVPPPPDVIVERVDAATQELRDRLESDRQFWLARLVERDEADREAQAKVLAEAQAAVEAARAMEAAGHADALASARLSTAHDLRAWQEATIAMVVGRLVRRELAHARKLASDPERASERLAAFYLRWTEDGLAELRPWLLRLSPEPALGERVGAMLDRWSTAAQAQCTKALGGAHGLDEVVRRWEIEREASLTVALMEAINGA